MRVTTVSRTIRPTEIIEIKTFDEKSYDEEDPEVLRIGKDMGYESFVGESYSTVIIDREIFRNAKIESIEEEDSEDGSMCNFKINILHPLPHIE